MEPKLARKHPALLLAGALAFGAAFQAPAQVYPAKPVRIVVPFGAGGSIDALARIAGQKLGEAWGQPVVIENRAGAGGNLGSEVVAKAAPNGYSLLFHTMAIAINASLYRNLSFDTGKDLAPVTQLGTTNGVFIVASSLPVQTVGEVIALARSQPKKLAYASTGSGSSGHLFMVLFISLTGVDMLHVPYKNISQQQVDIMSGRTPLTMSTLPSAMPHIKSGKFRALAVTGSRRSDVLPDVPTLKEAGVADYEAATWYGAFVPAGTPAAVTSRIHAGVQRTLALDDVRQRFAAVGLEPQGGSQEEFVSFFRKEIVKWGGLIKATGMTLD